MLVRLKSIPSGGSSVGEDCGCGFGAARGAAPPCGCAWTFGIDCLLCLLLGVMLGGWLQAYPQVSLVLLLLFGLSPPLASAAYLSAIASR